METRDHLALGRFLVETSGNWELTRHQRAFLLGCVEPDYNKATYLRGLKSHQKLRGHNAENSFHHVSDCMARLQTEGLHTAWDYFTLGTVFHYVADAFTWPHNAFWNESLTLHIAYEKNLHAVFSRRLGETAGEAGTANPRALSAFVAEYHRAYSAAPRDMETDCRYIIGVCERLLLGTLRCAALARNDRPFWKEAASCAGSYHHGLV